MSMYNLTTVAGVLEALNEDHHINALSDIPERVTQANVWHAIVSYPGCLGDSHAIERSRENVLDSVGYWLDSGEGSKEYSERYVKGQLRRFGICYLRDGRVITLEKHTIRQLF